MDQDTPTVTYNPSKPHPQRNMIWLLPLVAIVLCGLSFWGGTAYEKGHVKTAASSSTGFSGQFGQGGTGFGQRRAGGIGTVTAVSSTSITIQDSFNNSTKTYTINSSTTVTNNGSSASVSDIQTGDRVLIRTSASDSTQATSIDINPSFGGSQGQAGAGTNGSGSSTD